MKNNKIKIQNVLELSADIMRYMGLCGSNGNFKGVWNDTQFNSCTSIANVTAIIMIFLTLEDSSFCVWMKKEIYSFESSSLPNAQIASTYTPSLFELFHTLSVKRHDWNKNTATHTDVF